MLVLIGVSIAWVPIVQSAQGGQLFVAHARSRSFYSLERVAIWWETGYIDLELMREI